MELQVAEKYGMKGESKSIQKLKNILNEEAWTKLQAKNMPIERFRRIDNLMEKMEKEGVIKEAIDILKKHIEDYPASIIAPYMLGIFGYKYNIPEYTHYIGSLMESFKIYSKWHILEMLSEKVLNFGENTLALRNLALSLEKLRREKDAIPVLESIVRLDYTDIDTPYKLYKMLINDEPEKAITYLRHAVERAIHQREPKKVEELFIEYHKYKPEDISFLETVEKALYSMKDKGRIVKILKKILEEQLGKEDVDFAISLCKKILNYHPRDIETRKILISLYEEKYKGHSLFSEFLEISNLKNFKKPIKSAIESFEKHIVFDIGKYVYHRTWGVGKIKEITKENVKIDFESKKDHQMTLSMATKSLTPLPDDHILVLKKEIPDELKRTFQNEPLAIIEIILKSYRGKATLSEIKKEIIPFFIPKEQWAKWWSNIRNQIKKDSRFRQSPRKRDEYLLREKPTTIVEEIYEDFVRAENLQKKIQILQKLLSILPTDDATENIIAIKEMVNNLTQNLKKRHQASEKLLVYFLLDKLNKAIPNLGLKLDKDIKELIKTTENLSNVVYQINSLDIKKDFLKLVQSIREDWDSIFINMLYETPIKVHKFLFTFLVSSKKYKEINSFIQNVILGYRNFPEVFLWTAKNIFSKVWTYEWLDYPYDTLILNFFRLFKELQKIEPKGVRLKNLAMEILKSNNYAILREIVKEKDIDVVRKIYEMILDADFLDEAQKEELLNVIKSERKDILSHLAEEEKEEVKEEEDFVYITEQKYNELLEEFNKVVNVELPNVAKQISEAVEYGDLRENAEYKAALDKQNILRSMAKKLENDIKKARIIKGENIDTTKISIGTKVILLNMTEGEEEEYTILGPYEADYENHIISYLSPFGKAMMNKKVGDTFSINIGDEKREYKVIRIEKSDKI